MAGINPLATYLQTAFTTQTGTVYKTSIDANNIVAQRVVNNFACHAQATQNMTVLVEPGHILSGTTLTEIGAQTTLTLTNGSTSATALSAAGISNGYTIIAAAGVTNNATVSSISGTTITLSTAATTTATVAATICQVTGTFTAPIGNPRIDRVVVSRSTGLLSVVTGTPAATPIAPAITSGNAPVAQVLLQTSSTSITNSMITDERDTAAYGRGTAGELNVGTAANNIVQLDNNSKLPAVDGSQLTNIANSIYPVGSLYFSTVATNPNTLFGFGTWSAYAAGQIPIGVGTFNDGTTSKTVAGGDQIGEYNHTLTIPEIPSHSHSYNSYTSVGNTSAVNNGALLTPAGGTTGSTGGSGGHNNIQPSIGVYIWQRTA